MELSELPRTVDSKGKNNFVFSKAENFDNLPEKAQLN